MLNKFINLMDSICWRLKAFFSTILQTTVLRMRGIAFGRNIRFFGRSFFKRASTASIRIGTNCIFRSSATSNLIGINRPCIISAAAAGAHLTIGNNCGFSGTVIGCCKEITLGNNVRCGANTLITDSDWHPKDPRSGMSKPVMIRDNVWLGMNVTVLKGVTIGENSVIGAGSIVTKNIPANVVAAGNPCRVVKEISPDALVSGH